ncbi:MAG: DNA polymerase III subunit delta [Minisyncoccales bacterium]
MLIFLYGPDTYRSRQKLKEIIAHYQKIHSSGLNLISLNGSDLKFNDFQDIFQQSSMFDEKKLVIIANLANNHDFKEKFLENYKEFLSAKDLIVFYEEAKVSEKDKFFNFLKEKTKTQHFALLAGEKLKNWLKKELIQQGVKIEPVALDKLIEFVGNDLWQINNEINKLVNYKKGTEIKISDIELLVKPKIETAIFQTIDALVQRNRRQALNLIHQHLIQGDHPLYLLSMINFQFRNLLIVKDLIERQKPYYGLAKMTGLHPWVINKTYQQTKKFTLAELKQIYQKIFQTDLKIKTGQIDPETALDLLITSI